MADNSVSSNKINNIFENMSYFEEYNYDIWITFLIIFCTIVIVLYYYILNNIKSYRTEWQSQKCNPLLMPFASIINSQDENTDSNYVSTNFTNCLNKLNKSVADKTSTPIFSIFNILGSVFEFIASIASTVMSYILQLFYLLISLFMNFFSKLIQISNEISVVFQSINNVIGNVVGFMSVIYYQLVTMINALKLMGPIYVMSIFIGFFLPALVATTISLLTMIMIVFIAKIIVTIPFAVLPIGWITVGSMILPSTVAFLTCLAWLILITLILNVMSDFVERVFQPVETIAKTVVAPVRNVIS